MSLHANNFQKDFCHRCTHFTRCLLIGIYPYCEECIHQNSIDLDGGDNFKKLMEESGIIQIES